MTLQSFIDLNSKPLELPAVPVEMGKEIQAKLTALGILDPPIGQRADETFGPLLEDDGLIGAYTVAMMAIFAKRAKVKFEHSLLTPALAKALLQADPATFFPLILTPNPKDVNDGPKTKLAMRICKYMQENGYWIARATDFLNIVYLEGADKDGSLNADKFNEWNDRRIVFFINAFGKPEIKLNALGTTEPGKKYTDAPMNVGGAARIAFGQYKAWASGFHQGKRNHPALVQVGNVRVFRDKNKDTKRTGDAVDIGNNFGVNQHMAFNAPIVGGWSAGCLVGQDKAEHLTFLSFVKSDPRFKQVSSYKFVSTVIAADDLLKKIPLFK
jgi:hypothetical protein